MLLLIINELFNNTYVYVYIYKYVYLFAYLFTRDDMMITSFFMNDWMQQTDIFHTIHYDTLL